MSHFTNNQGCLLLNWICQTILGSGNPLTVQVARRGMKMPLPGRRSGTGPPHPSKDFSALAPFDDKRASVYEWYKTAEPGSRSGDEELLCWAWFYGFYFIGWDSSWDMPWQSINSSICGFGWQFFGTQACRNPGSFHGPSFWRALLFAVQVTGRKNKKPKLELLDVKTLLGSGLGCIDRLHGDLG